MDQGSMDQGSDSPSTPTSSNAPRDASTVDGSKIDAIRQNLAAAEHDLEAVPYTPPEVVIRWVKPLAAMARALLDELDRMVAAAAAPPVQPPGGGRPVDLIAELRAENERLRSLVDRQLGDCIGCTTEPEETCPRDGRSYGEWVEIASTVIGRENALETRTEYGVMTEAGWIPEYRGIKYARQQRTVHFRTDEPVDIDHWTYADHRHPVEGCRFCFDLAVQGKQPLTTTAAAAAALSVAPPPEPGLSERYFDTLISVTDDPREKARLEELRRRAKCEHGRTGPHYLPLDYKPITGGCPGPVSGAAPEATE
jgi:Fe-S-cluster-containing dehydrogenase component